MRKFLTTIELVDEELQRLGFTCRPDYTEYYPILKNDDFYARIIDEDTCLRLDLSVKKHHDRWANSSDFKLRIPKNAEIDLVRAIMMAKAILNLDVYDFNTLHETIPLQG